MFVFDIRGDGSVRDGLNICGTSRGKKALGWRLDKGLRSDI